jgi:hypothetical protein
MSEAISAIRSGQIVGIPTDTVYGLGVDPLQEEAVSRLFDIKGRPQHRPVGLLVATIEQAKMIGELGEAGESLARDQTSDGRPSSSGPPGCIGPPRGDRPSCGHLRQSHWRRRDTQ